MAIRCHGCLAASSASEAAIACARRPLDVVCRSGALPELGRTNMARKPQVAVEPRPDGRWAVQTDGTSRAAPRTQIPAP